MFSVNEAQNDKPPLICMGIHKPSSPASIVEIFLSGLGDCFHLMNNPNIQIKHEAERGHYSINDVCIDQ